MRQTPSASLVWGTLIFLIAFCAAKGAHRPGTRHTACVLTTHDWCASEAVPAAHLQGADCSTAQDLQAP
jgi:hypothetical protein